MLWREGELSQHVGVDAAAGADFVLDLPKHIVDGKLDGLRLPGAKPPERQPRTDIQLAPPKSAWEELEAGDAGAPDAGAAEEPERDEQGRPKALLRAIEEEVRKAEERALKRAERGEPSEEEADAGAPDPLDAGAVDAPVGEVEPDGGLDAVQVVEE